jgi:hypothetical protein
MFYRRMYINERRLNQKTQEELNDIHLAVISGNTLLNHGIANALGNFNLY